MTQPHPTDASSSHPSDRQGSELRQLVVFIEVIIGTSLVIAIVAAAAIALHW